MKRQMKTPEVPEGLLGKIVQTKIKLGNQSLKPSARRVLVLALAALVALLAQSCGDDDNTPAGKPALTGDVSIDGIMEVGKTVTANIANHNGGTGAFSYQWTADGVNIIDDSTGKTFLITAAELDKVLGVIIGNENTTGTKTATATTKVGPDPATLPRDQSEKLEDLFGEGFSVTVKGNFKDSEWTGIYGKVETELNSIFDAGNIVVKTRFRSVFGRAGVTIKVGNRPTGLTYETTGDGITLYINVDALDNADFQAKITAAIASMNDNGTETAKANKQIKLRNGVTTSYNEMLALGKQFDTAKEAQQCLTLKSFGVA